MTHVLDDDGWTIDVGDIVATIVGNHAGEVLDIDLDTDSEDPIAGYLTVMFDEATDLPIYRAGQSFVCFDVKLRRREARAA